MSTATISMPPKLRGLPVTKEYLEEIEDEYLLALAEERLKNDSGITYTAEEVYAELGIDAEESLKNDSGKTYSFEEILAEDGLTLDDLDDMEDVEIE